ncbi:hypothetical protein [Marininema halotolerans]|uniref:YD repeat-containing protein n=1 Tax=Marininema halotolerans TaxID=1155944 RepID=A0A1I6QJA0_9BACL|nr:hypothetical protein [Marininema halotolerans]SFS52521.1 hypothetical protein SAMN05444972_103187 [Marininema halotolerans]
MKYEELVEHLDSGREIEFTYKGKGYSITNTQDGFSFCAKEEDSQDYPTYSELLRSIRIDRMTLKDIWESVEIDQIY